MPAFDVGDWPVGIPITLRVRGRIQGPGGDGGGVGNLEGRDGGTALYTRYGIDLDLDGGEIWSGGGGGAAIEGSGDVSGGGGGAGQNPGSGGALAGSGSNGQPGTTEAGGNGASILFFPAGDGGDPGMAGEASADATGGQPGSAIDGDSFVNITASGDIRGAQVN